MEKFVVIGTGFIGSYMGKGMRKIAGTDVLQGIAFGIKGSNRDVEKKKAELGYDVSVNNTAEVLDKVLMIPMYQVQQAVLYSERVQLAVDNYVSGLMWGWPFADIAE